VFFNFFTAAKPYTSMKVTHGTPYIDPRVQRRTRGWSYRTSRTHFPSRAEPKYERQSRQRWPIWNMAAL